MAELPAFCQRLLPLAGVSSRQASHAMVPDFFNGLLGLAQRKAWRVGSKTMHIRLSMTVVPASVVTATLSATTHTRPPLREKRNFSIRCANSFGRLCQDAVRLC